MPIHTCPKCKSRTRVKDDRVGTRFRCPKCNVISEVGRKPVDKEPSQKRGKSSHVSADTPEAATTDIIEENTNQSPEQSVAFSASLPTAQGPRLGFNVVAYAAIAVSVLAVVVTVVLVVAFWPADDAKEGMPQRKTSETTELMLESEASQHTQETAAGDLSVSKLSRIPAGKSVVLEGQTDAVTAVAFSPDGHYAVSCARGADGTIVVWDLDQGIEFGRIEGHCAKLNDVTWSCDGNFIASAGGGTTFAKDGSASMSPEENAVILWDLRAEGEVRRFFGHEQDVGCVAICPQGCHVVSGSWDTTACVWDVASGELLRRFTGHQTSVSVVTVSCDGRRLLSGSVDGTICLWYLKSGREIRRLSGHMGCVTGLRFFSEDQRAVSCGQDKTIRVWNVETGKQLRDFKGHTSWVNCVAVSPDGRYMLSGSGGDFVEKQLIETDDNTVCLWDLTTGRLIRRLYGHEKRISSVAFSSDGQFALSGSWDSTVRVWRLPD